MNNDDFDISYHVEQGKKSEDLYDLSKKLFNEGRYDESAEAMAESNRLLDETNQMLESRVSGVSSSSEKNQKREKKSTLSPVVIKGVRKTMGLSQTELANKIGVSLRMFQYIEAGDRPCPVQTEFAIRWIAHSEHAFELPYEIQDELEFE